MKVLVSAYACEPNRGSESEVGWNWAVELKRLGYEVWILTRANNRLSIETEIADACGPNAPIFLYYDLPSWARWWKKGNFGVHLYYLLWQWGASNLARQIYKSTRFDLVHHVTFVSARQPSFMGRLGIPFILGPVAGGERAPWRLRVGYSWRGLLADAIRDLANGLLRIDPLMRLTFKQAKRIYVTSEQTKHCLPRSVRDKTRVRLAIGWQADLQLTLPKNKQAHPYRILYVGHFISLKGMHLGLRAFQILLRTIPDARLTLVGKGADEWHWRRLATCLGIDGQLDWLPWLKRSELSAIYCRHDVFFFPSLHDSGGLVVLEAMAHGLPVVCLNLGGPGAIVDDSCGRCIDVAMKSRTFIIGQLADALVTLWQNPTIYQRCMQGALERVKTFQWRNMVERISAEYSSLCSHR